MVDLQTRLFDRRHTSILVNGNTYAIDGACTIRNVTEADAKKLLSLGNEWTADVKAPAPLGKVDRIPKPGGSLRGAREFVALVNSDAGVQAKVASFRSFEALKAFAETLAFRFTEVDFKDALRIYEVNVANRTSERIQPAVPPADAPPSQGVPKEKPVPAKQAAKEKAPEKEAPSKKKEPRGKTPAVEAEDAYRFADQIPKELMPEEKSGVWPDPSAGFSLAYLKRMASAYKIPWEAGWDKATAVQVIHSKMYDE